MRPATVLRLARACTRPPVVLRMAWIAPSRSLSTTSVLAKKSKAAAVKRSNKQSKEEDKDTESEVDLNEVLGKTERKMEKAVDWAKSLVYEMVERGRGRVSPSLLDGIKVSTPDMPGTVSLNSVASVTVQKQSLVVNIWDPDHAKYVEKAIHEANLPGVSPTKENPITLRIPISRPTHEQRQELLKQVGTTVETAKNQVRHARQDGLNSVGGRGEDGSDDVQKLANDFGGQLDELLSQAKKQFEK